MAIPINSKMKPRGANGVGDFALIDAEDIEFKEGRLTDFLFTPITQEEYYRLKSEGLLNENTPYLIVEDDAI